MLSSYKFVVFELHFYLHFFKYLYRQDVFLYMYNTKYGQNEFVINDIVAKISLVIVLLLMPLFI